MACGGCAAKNNRPKKMSMDVMGGYKYLTDKQIKARLEIYKRKYCTGCEKRYECDYSMYTECKNVK